ncbi:MAG: hypothetical protein KBT27_09850 [Prevotellaceae bacterium]|nr:hypothetical protein [Candidatus Faecinaster equi]
MSDYRELIGDIGDLLIAHPSEHISKRYLKSAADAIEQLVRERDATCKERDAAVKDIVYLANHPTGACNVCNGKHCQRNALESGGCDFEWRGVQE